MPIEERVQITDQINLKRVSLSQNSRALTHPVVCVYLRGKLQERKKSRIPLLSTILFGLSPTGPRWIMKSNKYKVMFCLVSQAGAQLSSEHKAGVEHVNTPWSCERSSSTESHWESLQSTFLRRDSSDIEQKQAFIDNNSWGYFSS